MLKNGSPVSLLPCLQNVTHRRSLLRAHRLPDATTNTRQVAYDLPLTPTNPLATGRDVKYSPASSDSVPLGAKSLLQRFACAIDVKLKGL